VSTPTDDLSRVDLITPELWEEQILHDEFALLRREDPVHWHDEPAPNHGFWAITKHEDVVAVSKNPQVFSSGEGLTMLEEVEPESLSGFDIRESAAIEGAMTLVSPDIATCPA
jgi:cholest-4-en-3-one 26-monooxygenase